MTLGPASVVVRSDDAVAAPLGEELAMMDVESGKYYMLDAIASDVWAKLESPTSVGDLLAGLRQRYEVTPEQCESDVLALLERMHAKGLVRIDG